MTPQSPSRTTLAVLAVAACFGLPSAAHAAQTCETLNKLDLPATSITRAESVPAGSFTPPAGKALSNLPAFCRVAGVINPSSDSDIQFEVWMPASNWNGKFQGVGNGGFAGAIGYDQMGNAVAHNYATAATDTGHHAGGTDAAWALDHPDKIADFGYRAIHETAVKAKAILHAFYGADPQRSYFSSCSNGGRQALMEAQRYPEDYDGIIAGAPATYWTHLLAGGIWNTQALSLDPASYIPARKLPAIASAVNDACDKLDGVTDGILNDPRQCHFDPNVLLCKEGDADGCLTSPQIIAMKKLYEGARDSYGGLIYPGFLPGAELGGNGWANWVTGTTPRSSLGFEFAVGFFADMVYQNADWDISHASLDQAVVAADQKMAAILNATDANLAAFKARGGKLIIYHGWNDPAISALNTIN